MNTIKNHWLKIVIICLLSYVLFQKDFSFRFNVMDKNKKPKEVTEDKYTSLDKLDYSSLSFFNFFSSNNNSLLDRFEKVEHSQKVSFLKRFGKVAREEQERFGIPASIILATAMLQSEVGNTDISTQKNNFFGLKDEKNQNFIQYNSAWESYRGFSIFINKYISKRDSDYKIWINELKISLNLSKEYAHALETIIDKYSLYKLDN